MTFWIQACSRPHFPLQMDERNTATWKCFLGCGFPKHLFRQSSHQRRMCHTSDHLHLDELSANRHRPTLDGIQTEHYGFWCWGPLFFQKSVHFKFPSDERSCTRQQWYHSRNTQQFCSVFSDVLCFGIESFPARNRSWWRVSREREMPTTSQLTCPSTGICTNSMVCRKAQLTWVGPLWGVHHVTFITTFRTFLHFRQNWGGLVGPGYSNYPRSDPKVILFFFSTALPPFFE